MDIYERLKKRLEKTDKLKSIDKRFFGGLLFLVYAGVFKKLFFLYYFLKFQLKSGYYKRKHYSASDDDRIIKVVSYVSSDNLISKICEDQGANKGSVFLPVIKDKIAYYTHKYSHFYDSLFCHCREDFKLVFECGIGTINPNMRSHMPKHVRPGSSLRMWRDYFENAHVYGADIDKNILFSEDRISTHYVDQLSSVSIKAMWEEINKSGFDLMVDDGLHTYEAGITLFENSYDKLRDGGVYIIEDAMMEYQYKILKRLAQYKPMHVHCSLNGAFRYVSSSLIVIRKGQ